MSKFRIEGLSDVNAALANLPRGLGKAALVRVGKRRLQPMADAAKAKAPRQSGALQESIIVGTQQGSPGQRRKRFADKSAVEVYMGPTADGYPQALPEEFGSPNNPPHGYMRGAWENGARALLDGIAADLGQEVDAAAKRYARKLARKG
ncbi:hypothetical protein [Sphingomonas sp. MMS24-J13]|uniref:hypothetical protein n=1 Tax=Sphingomonas sp. MMS24-J13 TaxID=3238686 RepID=UPI00384CDE11